MMTRVSTMQDGGDGEGRVEVTLFLGVHVQCHGEGGACAVQPFPEAVQSVGKASGEQQGGGLAQDTAHGQDAAGDDAVHAAGQHHRADDPPLACAQAEGAFPVALGHGLQALLGSAHDGGQVHDDQGQGAGQQGGLHIQELAEEQHTHQAIDDGGNAGEGLGGIFDDSDHLFAGGVLGQVDGSAHAQRAGR